MNNKSIFILNTPDNCYDCPLSYDSYSCMITGSNFFTRDNFDCCKSRLENCPLSPLPEKISLKQYTDNTVPNIESILSYQYAQGWNGCIQEMAGKNNE